MLLCIANCAGARQADSQIIHFPSDRSMGMLYILDVNKLDKSSDDGWEPLCEATGDVMVPAGEKVRLNLSKEAGNDLSPLSALQPDDLAIFFCQGVEIADDQLRHISHLTGLEKIDFQDTNILGTGLKYLYELKSLKKLWLSGTHIGDNELSCLLNFPVLKGLGLRDTPTTDAGMVHLGKITSLEVLSLSAGVGDEGLAQLKGLKNLRWLSTGDRGVTDKGLACLAGLINLEYLGLEGAQVTDAGLVYLKNMSKLKKLRLYGTLVTEKGFVHLEGLQNLENLQVLFGVTETGLKTLSKLPSLKSITVDGDSLSEKGIALLSKFKSLEHVYIDNTDKMDAIVKETANVRGLKELTIGTGLTDEGLVELKNMRFLEVLTIGPSRITGKGISVLAQLPSLHALALDQARLDSEDDWAAIGRLTALQSLSLRCTRSEVTDAYIAHLTGLKSLRDLSIDAIIFKDRKAFPSMGITDKGLEYISKLKSLESLSLRGAKITDEGLQKLSEIPRLKWLDLQGCNVTEQGLKRLKKKLPALSWYL
jgi:Leucine-rich repeat (LRR) protein